MRFDPDLTRFRNRGGRLLLYHGWNDPSISPLNTINYYEKVVGDRQEERRARSGARTRNSRGCSWCPACCTVVAVRDQTASDMLTALEQWVEQKQPPERVEASHATNGAVDRTRPLCVYPKSASYSGFWQHGRWRQLRV
jgi:feruloyl esterase